MNHLRQRIIYSKSKYGLLLVVLSFTSCLLLKRHIEGSNYNTETPPGTIKIKTNLFYDETEVTNLDWLEYLFWMRRTFGSNSEEFKATLPDTNTWKEFPCLSYFHEQHIYRKDTFDTYINFQEEYLRHPLFRNYPVVGISQEQALAYSKWRSDRVFEYMLIRDNKIKMNSNPNKDNCFTIESYLSGNYLEYKPDSNCIYYPTYRLPSKCEWELAMSYADSIIRIYLSNHPRQKAKQYNSSFFSFQSSIVPCENDTFSDYPTTFKYAYKTPPFYNLLGNVSEWTSEKDVCIGGGWADSRDKVSLRDTFLLKTQNAWTGFRNVCEWKKWEK